MESSFGSRLKHAWNAFFNKDPTIDYQIPNVISGGYSYRPDRYRFTKGGERTIIASIYNRIAVDCASIDVKHVRLDYNGRFLEEMNSDLNECLTVEANVDQTGRSFIEDAIISMLDEGCVAIVPVDASLDPTKKSDAYDIETLRTGKIVQWFPRHVRVRVYNEITGRKEEIVLPKKMVAIVENPFYSVMNEPNSTLQRLIRKLGLSDYLDEQTTSKKLDLIIQLPYIIKTESRRKQAEQRRNDIINQLSDSDYGIAYTDGTEKITQLNRPIENQLASQIEYLTSMLYSQLGMTQEILNGTADEKTMLNYYSRTIEPILSALTEEMKRKFLSKTARTQGQSIEFFRDPFKLVPTSQISEMADKFTRNEIMTSNEIRQIIGMKPSDDPNADELRNKNLSASSEDPRMHTEEDYGGYQEENYTDEGYEE